MNSTAFGGGVAEMLCSLIGYVRGAGLDGRWVVADGDPEFFHITKRLHNRLHGFVGDGGPLGDGAGGLRAPLLGTRGVRLGLLHPEIYEMQARAIFRAARAVRERTGHTPSVEAMIPLVAYTGELAIARSLVERVAAEEGAEGVKIGTMIELPRACLKAGAIAAHADFFSFGTNDLTQTGLGFSRDDIEGRIMPLYANLGIVERSPFGGSTGEHGGDPSSIGFFHAAGLDYVSCSPFRVPIARVAAAQAAVAEIRTSGR